MIDIEETTFDVFLRYGLFFGAIFQLVCLGAAIFGSDASDCHTKVSTAVLFIKIWWSAKAVCYLIWFQDDNSEDSGSEHGSPNTAHKQTSSSHNRRKMDKKKRRWTSYISSVSYCVQFNHCISYSPRSHMHLVYSKAPQTSFLWFSI